MIAQLFTNNRALSSGKCLGLSDLQTGATFNLIVPHTLGRCEGTFAGKREYNRRVLIISIYIIYIYIFILYILLYILCIKLTTLRLTRPSARPATTWGALTKPCQGRKLQTGLGLGWNGIR